MPGRKFDTLRQTARGFAGFGGGRWGRVPQPPAWYTTSVQVCGIYPFGAGAARPTAGAPLGRDILTGSWVATDPDSLYRSAVISSPSMMLFGINGVGKSSTFQTMMLGMVGRGITPAIFDPIKGEHVEMIRQLEGTVFRVGPGLDKLNLLDAGPLGDAARRIGGPVGAELLELAARKAVDQTQAMVRISRKEPVKDTEDMVLEALVRFILARIPRPGSADLFTCFRDAPDEFLTQIGYSRARFHERFEDLGESLQAMLTGELGQMLGGDESVRFDAGNPGGFCFDTSAIPESNTKLLSAAMLGTWSLGMDAIDAHWELAQHEQRKAVEAAAAGERYEPAVRWGGYVTGKDEFWYPIRHVPGIIDFADRLSRTNRSKGTCEITITHSPKDFLSLPNVDDREKARGLTERSGLLGLMSLTRDDLEVLSRVRGLTEQEINLVASFNAAKSWAGPGARARAAANKVGGKPTPPPGAGKILLKVPERVGVPVQMVQPDTQARHHVTDSRYRNQ